MKTKKRTAILERDQARTSPPDPSPGGDAPTRREAVLDSGVAQLDEGLWCIGLMRVAQEWSDPRAPGLSAIVHGVAERMGLPPDRFEIFVAEELGALLPGAD